jgi:hypothetical protein
MKLNPKRDVRVMFSISNEKSKIKLFKIITTYLTVQRLVYLLVESKKLRDNKLSRYSKKN